jgi:hypothetical protein
LKEPGNSVGAGRVRAKKGSQPLDLKQLWRMHRLLIMCGMFLMAKAQVSDFNGRRYKRRISYESEWNDAKTFRENMLFIVHVLKSFSSRR